MLWGKCVDDHMLCISFLDTGMKTQVQQYVKSIIHHEQIGFITGLLEWFNLQQLITVINDIIG